MAGGDNVVLQTRSGVYTTEGFHVWHRHFSCSRNKPLGTGT